MFGESKTTYLKQISVGIWTLVAFLGFYLLYIGSSIFLPLIISIFLLILFTSIYNFFHKFVKRKYLSAILAVWLFFGFFLVVGYIIGTQIESFSQNTGNFTKGFENILNATETFLMTNFKVDLKQYMNFEFVTKYLKQINYSALSGNFFGTVSTLVSSIATVFMLLTFLLLEKNAFTAKIHYMFDGKGTDKMQSIIQKIYEDLNTYFVSKFFIAVFNGVIATIIMLCFGLDFALMFGLIVFIFDFVPVVGGIIALGLPFLYSLVTFWSVPLSFFMLLVLNIPQFISGNIIEPKIMGEKLNLSSFFLIIALLFWSMFWGLLGAFLATPILATMTIIFSKFETTKPIAILLSQNGKIK